MIAKRPKTTKIGRMAKTYDEIRTLKAANLKRIRLAHKLTQTKLANLISTYPSTLNAIEKGNKGLGNDLLVRICQALQVDASEFTRPIDDLKPIPPPAGQIAVISMANGGPQGFYEDAYPAGHGFSYIERPYDVTDDNAYAVEVRGISMSPRYEDGEIVVASPQREVRNGDYVVVKLATGEVMIKKIKFREGLIILTSVNPTVDAWVCRPEEVLFYHKIVWHKEKT